ncbi:glycoside hydrolase domain-containing protein [Alicyclobacillus fodiniaquatilis]|uniref:Glycoside hydrolase domain-containing protein n=1 Tax=Alicyclobacillus fodiniaquatilis TaxID=1661150 RepID=A0ABW4JI61_9BACL
MTKIKKAVDCATVLTASSAQAIKHAGYGAVLRYLGNWQKSLGAKEPTAILNARLVLGLIWEGDPTSVKDFTAAQAKSDVQGAVASVQSSGAPPGTGIVFTADYDAASADMSAIVAYFGVIINQITDYKPGAYGDYAVLTALYQAYGDKLFYWQTSGWSNGKKFAQAVLYQHVYDQSIGGVACDVDTVSGDPHWWAAANKTVGGSQLTTKYPAVQAQLNGKSVLAIAVGDVTYLIWTVARDIGLNITKADLGDVEIDGKKPPQVVQDDNTYIEWSSIPGLTAHKLSGGGFNFTTKPASTSATATHDYQLVVSQPATEIAGTWAPITITTMDGDTPVGHQIVTITVNGVQVCKDYTDQTSGGYEYDLNESTNKTDTVAVSWTDPSGKTRTVTNSTQFQVPTVTSTPLPSDDSVVVQFPLLPSSDSSNAILFDAKTTTGADLTLQLDTGAFELMLTAADAKALNAPNLGATSVQGVGGQSQAYYSQVDVVINGVAFEGIKCVVDPGFAGNSLFGYQFFIDNKYELLVSQKHNTVTFCK